MISSATRSYTKYIKPNRSDAQWLYTLRDQADPTTQQEALKDLSDYLHAVAFNYLRRCRAHSVTLQYLGRAELGALAEDHVHTFMEKLIRDDFVLLEKYHQRGRFLAWAAAVLTNIMASEMRKSVWRKQVPFATNVSHQTEDERVLAPDRATMQRSISRILHNGICEMPEHYQIALTRCLLEGEPARDVAESLGITPNAVHMILHRAKKNLLKYLMAHDVDRSVIALFA